MIHKMENGIMSYVDSKKQTIILTNFEARITEENRYIDGKRQDRYYVIEGISEKGDKLEEVIISSEEFSGMRWINAAWGSQAIIFPTNNSREIIRSIIQLESDPKVKTVYMHTGWVKIKKQDAYLTNNSAIFKSKRTSRIQIEVPPDLKHYSLPLKSENVPEAIKTSLSLTQTVPEETAWMILGAIYRSVLGSADFVAHISGRTGTYKSEIAAIAQSHFGELNARELPGNWSSTANALEALAYRAKDTLFVIDDFIPSGTSWQVKSYQKTADQIIRGQGNQAGRARLTDTSRLQETMYPRGIILSTGEDTPEGHSVRGRMMISELSPGDIQPKKLTEAQNKKHMLPHVMAEFIQWIAGNKTEIFTSVKEIAKKIRDENLGIGHARTPDTIGQLLSGIHTFLIFCETQGMSNMEQNKQFEKAQKNIISLGKRQIEYLIAADPADQFISILRSIFAANAGHAKGMNGGIPKKAMLLGWTIIGDEEDREFKPHGPRLGWVDEKTKTLYLDSAVAYDTIRRHSRGAITITRQTLYKRLREAGLLTKHDETRQRNTIRVQCEGAGRQVLAVSLDVVTEGEIHG